MTRSTRPAAAALVVLAACTGDSRVVPDAPPLPVPFEYDLGVFTGREPARADPPTVFIDGVATTSISLMYERAADAEGTMHLVELRYAEQVIATWPVPVHATPHCTLDPLTRVEDAVEEYDTGDLRDSGWSEHSGDRTCYGDPSWFPNCYCNYTEERCGLRIVRDAPVFTHLRCTAIGPKQLGDACSFTADPDGAYDDCGTDLICYQGTCHGLCNGMCGSGCVRPDGYPLEATLCM